jgi:DNA replicative helicase MCM subunit Mcm2 (Cdc46/Mcm family)
MLPKRPIKLSREQAEMILSEVASGSSVRMAIKIVTERFNEAYVHLLKNNFPDIYAKIETTRKATRLFNKG